MAQTRNPNEFNIGKVPETLEVSRTPAPQLARNGLPRVASYEWPPHEWFLLRIALRP
ncbi:hypothetical protein PVK06_021613 [Gossypium arboreum]|uniref:Uncharacterized protein n=1 Tax=Gossypium arboreum TaxID=29729 RepID=A0ABR0PQG7_GOSAR|nr:hypothetical protein PVK06_021613 [Gossypium arboreum]